MKGSNRRANWTFKISNNNRPQISWHCEHKWPSCRTFPFICELSSSLFSITFSASHTHSHKQTQTQFTHSLCLSLSGCLNLSNNKPKRITSSTFNLFSSLTLYRTTRTTICSKRRLFELKIIKETKNINK